MLSLLTECKSTKKNQINLALYSNCIKKRAYISKITLKKLTIREKLVIFANDQQKN